MTRVPFLIARTELKRSARVLLGDLTRLVVLIVLGVIGGLPFLAGLGFGAYALGQSIQFGVIDTTHEPAVRRAVGGGVALAWFAVMTVALIRAVTHVGSLDHPSLSLLNTSLSNTLLGLTIAEYLRFGIITMPVVTVVGTAFAIGVGEPVYLLAVPSVTGMLLVGAVPVGLVLGIGLRHLMITFRPIARLRTPLILGIIAIYIYALVTARFESAVITVAGWLSRSPFAWPGELLLAPLPGGSYDPVLAGGAVIVTGGIPVIAIVAGRRLAGIHWYRDPPVASSTEWWPAVTLAPIDRGYGGVVSNPVRVVAITALRRTIRAPVRMLYVAYPAMAAIFFVVEFIRRGQVHPVFFVALSVYVTWGTGALLTLNPLGDLGRVIAVALTAPVTGRALMRGYWLAACTVGIPLAGIVISLATVSGAFSTGGLIVYGLATLTATILAPALALGVGALFPRFGSVELTSKREAVMPSKFAFVTFSTLLSVPAGAATILALPTVVEFLASGIDTVISTLDATAAEVGMLVIRLSLGVPLILAIALAFIAYRYACFRFDNYHLP